jgi:hypothetical protein
MKPWMFGGGLVCGLLLLLLVGLGLASLGGGAAEVTLPSGRSISAKSDTPSLRCDFQTDTATIIGGGRTIIVRPERLEVDGQHAADIAPEARDISVSLRRGQVHMVADGSPVAVRHR